MVARVSGPGGQKSPRHCSIMRNLLTLKQSCNIVLLSCFITYVQSVQY